MRTPSSPDRTQTTAGAIRLTPVRRLGGRALLLFGAYTAVILAVVIAGFLSAAVGIWASVLWGAVLLGGLVLYLRRRSRRPRVDT